MKIRDLIKELFRYDLDLDVVDEFHQPILKLKVFETFNEHLWEYKPCSIRLISNGEEEE